VALGEELAVVRQVVSVQIHQGTMRTNAKANNNAEPQSKDNSSDRCLQFGSSVDACAEQKLKAPLKHVTLRRLDLDLDPSPRVPTLRLLLLTSSALPRIVMITRQVERRMPSVLHNVRLHGR
jgi:hypothetical protein